MAYYNRYRGSRRRRQNRFKILLLVLLLLVVVGLAALFFLQDAVVFTADGFHFPFTQNKENPAQSDPVDPDDIHLEIEAPQPGAEQLIPPAEQQPSQPVVQPQPEPEPVEAPHTAALLVTAEELLADRAAVLRRISEGSYTQLAVRVKTPDGLALVNDGLVKDGVSEDSAAFLEALDGVDLPKIAVISALRDNVRPRTGYRSSALHTSSGATWLDKEYIAWFDPAGKDTLHCLAAMIEACEQAGFEQVVLENFHCPNAGKIDLIDYGEGYSRQSALTELARQLREATDLPLGLILTETAATDLLDSVSGQDVAELAQYFDLLYLPAQNFSADRTAAEHAAEDTDCRVALLLNTGGLPPAGDDVDYLAAP